MAEYLKRGRVNVSGGYDTVTWDYFDLSRLIGFTCHDSGGESVVFSLLFSDGQGTTEIYTLLEPSYSANRNGWGAVLVSDFRASSLSELGLKLRADGRFVTEDSF